MIPWNTPNRNRIHEAKVRFCAESRVRGHTWAWISERLKTQEATIRAWTTKNPQLWARLMTEAIDHIMPEAENEALQTARQFLRHDEPKTQNMGMTEILRHSRELRGIRTRIEITGAEGTPFSVLPILGQLTKDDVKRILAQFLEDFPDGGVLGPNAATSCTDTLGEFSQTEDDFCCDADAGPDDSKATE